MSTQRRDEIRELATAVGGGLSAYIAVHDTVFQDASTLKSVLKNLFGRGVPMANLLHDAEALLPFWASTQDRTQAFRQRSYAVMSRDEQHYFDLLSRYVDALTATVAALVDRQRLLNEGSKGGTNNPMTWQAFQETDRAYQIAVQRYIAIGGELNDAAPIIFEDHS